MSTQLYEFFRANVRTKMAEFRWTQQDLANAMGVTQGYVSHVLTGRTNPGLDVVQDFADALGVHPLDLLGEKIH